MEALLLPFGSPVKDARTLIASKVEARVKTPGVVDAKAEPEIRLSGTGPGRLRAPTVSHAIAAARAFGRSVGRIANELPWGAQAT